MGGAGGVRGVGLTGYGCAGRSPLDGMRSLGRGIHACSAALQRPERRELKLLVSLSSKRSVAAVVIALSTGSG